MTSFEFYQQIETNSTHKYKLLQLNDDLLEYMDKNEGKLLIKSSDEESHHLVLCTSDKTWKVRQMNHSNDVILANDIRNNKLGFQVSPRAQEDNESSMLVGFSKFTYEYELSKTQGSINTNGIPTFNGNVNSYETHGLTVDDVRQNLPISDGEFSDSWFKIGGCEVAGKAVLLSEDFITTCLNVLISLLIAKNVELDSSMPNIDIDTITKLMGQEDDRILKQVCLTIIYKFGKVDPQASKFALCNREVARWYGILTLKNTMSQLISPNEFLIKWKSTLPLFYNTPIDLSYLIGFYCSPSPGMLQYLDPNSLSRGDLHLRIKELFSITKEWDYDEFLPLVLDFIPEGKKPEAIILKYARKRRVSKNKFIVSPR